MRGILLATALLSASPMFAEAALLPKPTSGRPMLRAADWTPPGTLIFPRFYSPGRRLNLPAQHWAYQPTKFDQSLPVRIFNYMNRPMQFASVGPFRLRFAIIFE